MTELVTTKVVIKFDWLSDAILYLVLFWLYWEYLSKEGHRSCKHLNNIKGRPCLLID